MLKKCCMCKLEKDIEAFSLSGRAKDGRQTQCRACALEYSRRPEQKKKRSELAAYRWRNGKIRDDRYQELYGITAKDYYRMLFEQGEVCKICGQSSHKALAVDHNHDTGQIRGLLCKDCNTGLGLFKDSMALIEKAAAYLAVYENQTTPGEPNG